MNVELRFATSFTTNDSSYDKYQSHGQLDTSYGTLYMICSGVGDSKDSVIAGGKAFEVIRKIITSNPGGSPEKLLRSSIIEANRTVYEWISKIPHKRRTGSEVVAFLIDTAEMHNALICYLGCGRVYRIWDGNITRINKSHSRTSYKIEQETIDRNSVRSSSENKMQNRFIGIREKIEPEIQRICVQKGDRYIICTGSIAHNVDETEIIQLFDVDAQKYADCILESATKLGCINNPVVQIIDTCSSSESGRKIRIEPIKSNQQNRTEL